MVSESTQGFRPHGVSESCRCQNAQEYGVCAVGTLPDGRRKSIPDEGSVSAEERKRRDVMFKAAD